MEDVSGELFASVERIEALLAILVRWGLSDRLAAILKGEKERTIYCLTGLQSQSEITKAAKVSARDVSNLWKRLEEQGVIRKVGASYVKVFEDSISDS